jgi:N-carbamoylputrescine amidase
MFNERARAYGRQKASLLVIPRASGTNIESWKIAGAMASLVAGAYVVSSNRVGTSSNGTQFGGGGFAYAPRGRLLVVTTAEDPLRMFEFRLEEVISAQSDYPCYVPEIT